MKFKDRFKDTKVGGKPSPDLELTQFIYSCWANGFTGCGARTGWRDVSGDEAGVPCCSDECFQEMRGRPITEAVWVATEEATAAAAAPAAEAQAPAREESPTAVPASAPSPTPSSTSP